MIQKFGLHADLLVGQRVGRVARWLEQLLHAIRTRRDQTLARLSIETARAITLRISVVEQNVGCDMPGEVAAAAETVERLSQANLVEVLTGGAGIRYVGARCARVILRSGLEFVVMIPARATGDRQHLRNDVKVDGGEQRVLFVAALQVLAERRGVAALARVCGGGTRLCLYIAHAGGTARQSHSEISGVARRDRLVVEVHVVLDQEILIKRADETANPPIVRRADADFVGLVS